MSQKLILCFAIIASSIFSSCIAYHHTLPLNIKENNTPLVSSHVFNANILSRISELPEDGRIKSSNILMTKKFKTQFLKHLAHYRSINSTTYSNYTIIIDFQNAGRINTINFIATFASLLIVPMRDNKLLNVKIQVFHKSGRHIKTYIYTTGHTEWMGLISYPLLSVFSSFSKNNWFTDVNRLNYSQDADIIFSNFIADFNRDITNNQYPEFAATTVSQNEMITGVEMFGKLEDGLSVLQVKPGLIYRGNIKDGLPNGLGSLSDGSTILIGEWINGKLSGKGKIQYADGSVYSGMLLDSRPHGQGKLIKPDNEIKEGQWNNGIFEQ